MPAAALFDVPDHRCELMTGSRDGRIAKAGHVLSTAAATGRGGRAAVPTSIDDVASC